jgi:putative tryptophan/tyrosine transport system substrate-binding protein
MSVHMNRRAFITLLGGAAAWPLAARAQLREMPVIGFLHPTSPDTNEHRLRAFRAGLNDTGYVEGENVTIAYRWAENQGRRLPELVADLIRRQVTVTVAPSTHSAFAAKATTTIPVVFAVGDDPVKLGLVASLARPGGNATGINYLNAEVAAKRLELLRDMVPGATRVAVLTNPANPNAEITLGEMSAAGRGIGLQFQILKASSSREINAAFAAAMRERTDAVFVLGDSLFTSRRVQLATLAAHHRIPAIYGAHEITEAGGLMSYASSIADAWRQVGLYTGSILKGTKPADLPVIQASKFELVINAETARILGLEIPPTLLARADEVIE